MKNCYLKSQKGMNLVEIALALQMFLIMVFGVIDFSRAMYFSYVMHRLSREGANLATRGQMPTLTDVRRAMVASAEPLNMTENGKIYIFKIKADSDQEAKIIERTSWGRPRIDSSVEREADENVLGREQQEKILNGVRLLKGETIIVVETYYVFSGITPLGYFMEVLPSGSPMGSKAVFYITPR